MKREFVTDRLDVVAFAQDGAHLEGSEPLRRYSRVLSEIQGLGSDQKVRWQATGELRPVAGGPDQVWLHLEVEATLPLTCQRCLGTVEVPLHVERSFRFVADEATAAAEDDEAEEDLLAVSQNFDLRELVEDELLMELPAVPRHPTCPAEVKLAVADSGFEAEDPVRPRPFAVLSKIKVQKRN